MIKANFYSPRKWLTLWGAGVAGLLLWLAAAGAFADAPRAAAYAADARARHLQAWLRFAADAENPTNAAELGCACYDAAEYATNAAERASLAREGMAACRQAITNHPDFAPAHYYLAMDMGQLAHTEVWSALALVREMEREFKQAASLDPGFDFAGPERNLGLLYLQAPRFGSIGNRRKAREFLERAASLAPEYPENHLNLAEVYLKWDEPEAARRELDLLKAGWVAAQARFTGTAWASSWDEWSTRRAADRKALEKRLASLASDGADGGARAGRTLK